MRREITVTAVVVVLVVGTAFELNNLAPSGASSGPGPTESTSTGSTDIGLTWFGAPTPTPSSCGREEAAFGGTGDGYSTTLYLPSGDGGVYLLGSTICILTNFQNSDNRSTSLPSTEVVKVLNSSSGATVYQGSCSVPSSSTGSFAPKSAWNCAVIWDTSKPYNGILPAEPYNESLLTIGPDPYVVSFTISLADSYQVQMGGGGIGLTTSLPSTTTVSSSASTTTLSSTTASSTTSFHCGTGQAFTPLTAIQGGPMYLKVTTDQGVIVNNGTVLVTHVGTNGTADYCINFAGGSQPNSTGYFSITANDGLSPTGRYNLTLLLGEPLPQGYVGSLPAFNVTANTSVAVNWSVPSGAVFIVTSTPTSNHVVTTTTTAASVDAWECNQGPSKVTPA